MADEPLDAHMLKSYRAMRLGLCLLGFLLPVVLGLGGWLLVDLDLQGSMSAYYHASPASQAAMRTDPDHLVAAGQGSLRDWFVGSLFAVGLLLVNYKGYTQMENRALNVAGVCGIGVALFPMAWGSEDRGVELRMQGAHASLHGAFAVVLFLCLAYVCVIRSEDTLQLVIDDALRSRYRRMYRVLGGTMIASPVAAFVLSGLLDLRESKVFFVESVGVLAFATYWLVKGREIAGTDADGRAARGEIKVAVAAGRSPLRKVHVTSA